MGNSFVKLLTILFLFLSSDIYADTIDFYSIYYNDSLIYQNNINHCNGSYWDTNDVYHIRNGEADAVTLDHIDKNASFKIEYYRDYGRNNDTMFLELQNDSGMVLTKYSWPINIPEGIREITIDGDQIISALKNNRLNSIVFAYYDLIIKEQESDEIYYLQYSGKKYVHEEDCRFKLIKIIIKKL